MTVLEINGFPIYGIGLIASFFLFVLIGFFAKGVLGKALNSVADHFFMSIPGIRGIYKTTKQITNNLFSAKGSTSFKKVVYAPFPSENSKCIAFLTGKTESGECMVFVPTAPNPTSGYVLIYKESQLQDCSLTVNEALQVVVSCGAMSPEKSAPPL